MSYSKAYQLSPSGRENEAIAFYGQNKVSCGRVTAFVSMGGQTQPTIVEEANEFVGKNVDLSDPHSTKHNLSTGKPPAIQVS